jgi:hypothetical protein
LTVLPRDFIETGEGLIFAVVDAVIEDGKILGVLRYVRRSGTTRPDKLDTAAANRFLRERHPNYLHHSLRLDASLHAVDETAIARHYRPRERLQQLLQAGPQDPMEARLCRLIRAFALRGLPLDQMGITGSLLIGAHTPRSDLDVVVYGRSSFNAAREMIKAGVRQGDFDDLHPSDWAEAYRRRGCALSFEEFVWHERRKANKALFEGTKFDLTQVAPQSPAADNSSWRKIGTMTLRAPVQDDTAAFDSPARYLIEHPRVREVVACTHTYVGQARTGELIEAAGYLEQDASQRLRLIVGTSREAPREYLRVLHQ